MLERNPCAIYTRRWDESKRKKTTFDFEFNHNTALMKEQIFIKASIRFTSENNK